MQGFVTTLLLRIRALVTGVPFFAQWDEWNTLNREFVSLMQQRRYDSAGVVANTALQNPT